MEQEIKAALDRPVVMTGMMGAGKSHIGRLLAAALGIPFADTDDLVEEQAGCTIAEIFERDGEARFRTAEKAVIKSQLQTGPKIMATGGGALMDKETLEAVLSGAVTIWLQADVDLLARRLERSARAGVRPLLLECDIPARLQKLLAEREPVYRRADIAVNCNDGSPADVLARTLQALDDFLRQKEARA